MKLCFVGGLVIFLLCSMERHTPHSDKIMFLFYQQIGLRPIGIFRQDFWSFREEFDTVIISSGNLIKKIENKFQTLSRTRETSINYQIAVVRYSNNSVTDTLYTDRFLKNWEIHGSCYEDKSRFFEKMFINFFDGQLKI